MKIAIFLILSLFLQENTFAKDPLTKVTIEVNGNCNMCKKNIEKAAKLEGVKKAKWDVETHELKLEFDPKIITLDQIQLRIAAVGYDTPAYKANNSTYNNLHECCQYERKK
ncbi:MAG: hypothetical protein IT267_07440 [Saprospiraceae bacterium]|nr:hypothetical protein [Saprospiraceae bacterium]